MKIIGIGDSVVDFYKDQGKIYPGGSSLNVAVAAKRNGATAAAYLGLVGTDQAGRHILSCLEEEGVDGGRVRSVEGPTGEAVVTLNEEGERIFVGTNKDTRVSSLVSLTLNPSDVEYVRSYDLIHTCVSINRGLELELPKLKGMSISFDFSSPEYWSKEYLELVAPYVTYAFFSGSDFTEAYVEELIGVVHGLGIPVVGVTRGSAPAVFSEKGRRFVQSPVEAKVVDTMGAGDSFIGAFLAHYVESQDMEGALKAAAGYAAEVCGYYGAFGYGVEKDV